MDAEVINLPDTKKYMQAQKLINRKGSDLRFSDLINAYLIRGGGGISVLYSSSANARVRDLWSVVGFVRDMGSFYYVITFITSFIT